MTISILIFGLFAVLGAWMLIQPRQYLLWLKDAGRSIRINEDDSQAISNVKFFGGLVLGFAVVALIAFTLNRK